MNSAAHQQPTSGSKAAVPAAEVAPKRLPGFQPRKGQRGFAPMKFLGSLRGDGALVSDTGEVAVAYQLDLYDGGGGRSGSGAVEGRLAGLEAGDTARLRLEGGGEVAVVLQETDAAGAVFETRGSTTAAERRL